MKVEDTDIKVDEMVATKISGVACEIIQLLHICCIDCRKSNQSKKKGGGGGGGGGPSVLLQVLDLYLEKRCKLDAISCHDCEKISFKLHVYLKTL